MHTYHIHICGLVQGVGFRPYVYRLARQFNISRGWVSNTNDGVHIECNASRPLFDDFYAAIIQQHPLNAIISHHHWEAFPLKQLAAFSIRESTNDCPTDLLVTPDIALCHSCKTELLDADNKRYRYPFTTCLHCGPRYSILTSLPFDRENTSMAALKMCNSCIREFNDIENRRHFSQTNSCPHCAIPMYFYSAPGNCISNDEASILTNCIAALKNGNIVAVKGVGGYLLMCDAGNAVSINNLRFRKHRPAKPFALLYADISMAEKDVVLRPFEKTALLDKSGPIVLCKQKTIPGNPICLQEIAPGLDKIGLMMPNSPLFFLFATAFGKPLIATSANISGSPIIHKDADALENLFEVADMILTYDREVVAAQDDSVLQFTDSGQKIILRRSRGLSPNYYPNPFQPGKHNVLAMGAELKSAFALMDTKNLYISQYLGDQENLFSQKRFTETYNQLSGLVNIIPQQVLIDKHPGYFVSLNGKELAAKTGNDVIAIQHHKAHFGAVLAENNLLVGDEKVLGFIWDGSGYGDDGQIWGAELFIFDNNEMERVAHLDYFPQLLGDKMSKEPRLSALSLLKEHPDKQWLIQKYFSEQAWQYYQQLILQPSMLSTSSMGRFLDGIAAILGIRLYNSYEGEAAMHLEVLARSCPVKPEAYYDIPLENNRLNWHPFITALLEEYLQKTDTCFIALKVFYSLVKMAGRLSDHFNIENIAFSGGVFQNALLNDLLIEQLAGKKKLYFHKQLSPNDECISFGQIACYNLQIQSAEKRMHSKEQSTVDPVFIV